MSLLKVTSPRECGLIESRWQEALRVARSWVDDDRVPCVGFLTARNGLTPGPVIWGRSPSSPGAEPNPAALFLVASITKPIVAMGVLRLVEQGLLTLNDRVTDFLPEFGKKGKYGTTIRNLLTHTSGLPDMLPNNRELRMAQAPLTEFVSATCGLTPDFPPGRSVQYQSMGYAVLGDIITRVTGQTCAEFLRDQFFGPLGMRETSLGAPDDWFTGDQPLIRHVADIRVPEDQVGQDAWNWNSRYWRQLGAPWGGLLTTPLDLGQFAQMMLNEGLTPDGPLLSAATVRQSRASQFQVMKDVPDEERRFRPWGLGWRLQWSSHANSFGDLVSSETYGHWGATGTLLWIDPVQNQFMLILTTEPLDPRGAPLQRLSNALVAAWGPV